MGFVEDMHEAWQYKAAELVRNVAEDLEAYHKRIDAAKDDVCEAAWQYYQEQKPIQRAKLKQALARLKQVRDE